MERLSNLVVAKVKILLSGLGLAYHDYLPCFVANMQRVDVKLFGRPFSTTEMQPRPSHVNSLQEEK